MRKLIASASVVLLSTGLAGQSSPLEGTWTLNVGKSEFRPGPPPKSATLKWEPVSGGLRFTTEMADAQGQTARMTTIVHDEREASVRGVKAPDRFLTRVDDRTYEDGARVNGKRTVSRRLVVSADGKMLTVTMSTTVQGQTVNNVAVYEKQ